MIIPGLYLYIFGTRYLLFLWMCLKPVVWHRPSVGSLSYPLWLPPGNHRQFLFTPWHGWMFAFLRCGGKMALSHTFVNNHLRNLRILNHFLKFLFVTSQLPEFNSLAHGAASKNAVTTVSGNGFLPVLWEDITSGQLYPKDHIPVDLDVAGIQVEWFLTLKRLGHFFQYLILFPNVVQQRCNIFVWNWSNKFHV